MLIVSKRSIVHFIGDLDIFVDSNGDLNPSKIFVGKFFGTDISEKWGSLNDSEVITQNCGTNSTELFYLEIKIWVWTTDIHFEIM